MDIDKALQARLARDDALNKRLSDAMYVVPRRFESAASITILAQDSHLSVRGKSLPLTTAPAAPRHHPTPNTATPHLTRYPLARPPHAQVRGRARHLPVRAGHDARRAAQDLGGVGVGGHGGRRRGAAGGARGLQRMDHTERPAPGRRAVAAAGRVRAVTMLLLRRRPDYAAALLLRPPRLRPRRRAGHYPYTTIATITPAVPLCQPTHHASLSGIGCGGAFSISWRRGGSTRPGWPS